MNSPYKRERTTITNVEKAKSLFGFSGRAESVKLNSLWLVTLLEGKEVGYSSHWKTQFYAREKSKEKLARCEFSHNISSIKPSSGKSKDKRNL